MNLMKSFINKCIINNANSLTIKELQILNQCSKKIFGLLCYCLTTHLKFLFVTIVQIF